MSFSRKERRGSAATRRYIYRYGSARTGLLRAIGSANCCGVRLAVDFLRTVFEWLGDEEGVNDGSSDLVAVKLWIICEYLC